MKGLAPGIFVVGMGLALMIALVSRNRAVQQEAALKKQLEERLQEMAELAQARETRPKLAPRLEPLIQTCLGQDYVQNDKLLNAAIREADKDLSRFLEKAAKAAEAKP